MFRIAHKLLLALSLSVTGCFAEEVSSEDLNNYASELESNPFDSEYEPLTIGGLPGIAVFDPNQRPPEDPASD